MTQHSKNRARFRAIFVAAPQFQFSQIVVEAVTPSGQ